MSVTSQHVLLRILRYTNCGHLPLTTQNFLITVNEDVVCFNLMRSAMSPVPSWVIHIAMKGTADKMPICRNNAPISHVRQCLKCQAEPRNFMWSEGHSIGGRYHLITVPLQLAQTRCSAIAERPRCRVRYSFSQKWKTGTGKQYFTNIIDLSSTTVT